MQNEMLGVEEAMNIEVGAVKTETVEVESELFGIVLTRGPTIKCADTDETVNRTEGYNVENWRNEFEIHNTKVKLEEDVNCEEVKIEVEEVIVKHEIDDLKDANGEIAQIRIKKEQVVKDWKNNLKMQDTKVELEEDVNYGELKIESEELIIKDENVDLNDANGEIDVNRMKKEQVVKDRKNDLEMQGTKVNLEEVVKKADLAHHMLNHPETADGGYNFSTCAICNAKFKSKLTLDGHMLREHPDSIGLITAKIYECTHCAFKAVIKAQLAHHMLKHPETADSYKFSTCVHCYAKYKQKICLDNHILRQHPEYIASVSSKIYECTYCRFKTVKTSQFEHHMLKHPETADRYKFSICVHCNATFKSKQGLDGHTLRKHPGSIESVSTKIFECSYCGFKTVKKLQFEHHMLKHPEAADRYKFSTCVHCNTTFKTKQALDGHTLREHPDAIGSISTKIYECTHCRFKTVRKARLAHHMFKHPGTAKFSTCVHCNATFKTKQALDGHTLRKHPDATGSISTKIHDCKHCSFKTVIKGHLTRHMLKRHKCSL